MQRVVDVDSTTGTDRVVVLQCAAYSVEVETARADVAALGQKLAASEAARLELSQLVEEGSVALAKLRSMLAGEQGKTNGLKRTIDTLNTELHETRQAAARGKEAITTYHSGERQVLSPAGAEHARAQHNHISRLQSALSRSHAAHTRLRTSLLPSVRSLRSDLQDLRSHARRVLSDVPALVEGMITEVAKERGRHEGGDGSCEG
eukprot:jgi/Chlat1/22/ChrspC229637S00906